MADQSAQKPDVAKLVARLRAQAKATGNSVVGGTMGEDMLAAAVVIEQQLLCSRLDAAGLVTALPATQQWRWRRWRNGSSTRTPSGSRAATTAAPNATPCSAASEGCSPRPTPAFRPADGGAHDRRQPAAQPAADFKGLSFMSRRARSCGRT